MKYLKKLSKLHLVIMGLLVVVLVYAISSYFNVPASAPKNSSDTAVEAHFKKILTPAQYHILREAGTEIPFSGALDYETRPGTYYSYGCDKPIFRSEQKYDSGTGWPSFWAPIKPDAVVLKQGTGSDGRTEVLDTCGSHLGHVFDDGPQPTGKRYCMNSIAMYFVSDKK
ncbi:MAG: methionine-R-sulfoxide reductase [Candidatus Saccharibacteria bacterium]|nr:methionine-R-sulfoxide reductase [Candidatus Saccharibacteria bacterium]